MAKKIADWALAAKTTAENEPNNVIRTLMKELSKLLKKKNNG